MQIMNIKICHTCKGQGATDTGSLFGAGPEWNKKYCRVCKGYGFIISKDDVAQIKKNLGIR